MMTGSKIIVESGTHYSNESNKVTISIKMRQNP